MRHLFSSLVLLAANATSAAADAPMTGLAFDAETRGQTVTYASDGQIFGAEAYLNDGQTIWQSADGTCVSGSWEARGEELCFAYTGEAVPTCWRFYAVDGKLRGILSEDTGALTIITEAARTETPLTCAPAPAEE